MLEDCVAYFKKNPAYKRIFMELRKKWKKYGKPSGYIVLKDASDQEREALKNIFGKYFAEGDIRFKVNDFEQALKETKFKGICLQELLEAYFSEKMHTNKLEREIKVNKKELFFETLLSNIPTQNITAHFWLNQVKDQKKYGYNIILSEYENKEENAARLVYSISRAIQTLEKEQSGRIRLAILGAEITSNPHYFDKGQIAGKLLIAALSFIHDTLEIHSAEDILELYYLSGIQPDDISSFTILYGISLYGNTGIHKAYEVFIEKEESYMVNLSNLSVIVKADCCQKTVFVFENQMVFSHMCERLRGKSVAMICTSGQMKTASWIVIDLLCKSGCKLYYSGDIDPEGIEIADKAISRHPEHIIPWRMGIADYKTSVSTKEVEEARIKKLEKVKDPRLLEAAAELQRNRHAAYQELLIEQMAEDIIMQRLPL